VRAFERVRIFFVIFFFSTMYASSQSKSRSIAEAPAPAKDRSASEHAPCRSQCVMCCVAEQGVTAQSNSEGESGISVTARR
jgi:hypothetical protein